MTPFEVFFFFFKINAMTFGGGIAILGMVRLEMQRRGVLSDEEIAEISNFAVAMPGPLAVSCAYMLGRRLAGVRGAVSGIAGAVLSPFLIVLLLSPVVLRHFDAPSVKHFFAGVLASVAAMIVVMVVRDVRRTLSARWTNLISYAAVLAMIGWFHIHPLLALLAGFALQTAVNGIAARVSVK